MDLRVLKHTTYNPVTLDNRVIGVNGLNQLVSNHFSYDSYAAIQNVSDNLHWLINLYKNLPAIQSLVSHAHYLDNFGANLHKVIQVADKLNSVEKVANKAEYLEQVLPELLSLKDTANNLSKQFGYYNRKLEEVRTMLGNVPKHVEYINTVAANQALLGTVISHLQASDAVELALFTKNRKHLTQAEKMIVESESNGNDESVNRLRLTRLGS